MKELVKWTSDVGTLVSVKGSMNLIKLIKEVFH